MKYIETKYDVWEIITVIMRQICAEGFLDSNFN